MLPLAHGIELISPNADSDFGTVKKRDLYPPAQAKKTIEKMIKMQ